MLTLCSSILGVWENRTVYLHFMCFFFFLQELYHVDAFVLEFKNHFARQNILAHRHRNHGGTRGMCPSPKFSYKLLTTLCVVSNCSHALNQKVFSTPMLLCGTAGCMYIQWNLYNADTIGAI